MWEPNTYNLQRRQYKIPKFYIIPMIDCFLVLTIFFFLVIVSERFAPIRAIPIYQTHGHGGFGWSRGKVFVKIDNPTDSNAEGAMYMGASVHPERVQYDEMLSLLRKLPDERKTMLLIYAGRQVYHEQIVRVLDMGREAGIDKVGFPSGGGGWPFVHIQPRR